jgi:small subunit ribosomal protein S17
MSDAQAPARPRAKTREGVVVSNKMEKTAVVSVARRVRHGKYMKTVVRHKHYMVHDESNECMPGDRVVIAETRPLSKNKRWRLSRILEKAVQVGAEVKDPLASEATETVTGAAQ